MTLVANYIAFFFALDVRSQQNSFDSFTSTSKGRMENTPVSIIMKLSCMRTSDMVIIVNIQLHSCVHHPIRNGGKEG